MCKKSNNPTSHKASRSVFQSERISPYWLLQYSRPTTDGLGEVRTRSGVVVVGIDLYWGSVVVAKAESSVITALTARGKVALCIMHLHLARINCNYHHVNRYQLVNLPS